MEKRSAQVWHVLARDGTVLSATHKFNALCIVPCLPSLAKQSSNSHVTLSQICVFTLMQPNAKSSSSACV